MSSFCAAGPSPLLTQCLGLSGAASSCPASASTWSTFQLAGRCLVECTSHCRLWHESSPKHDGPTFIGKDAHPGTGCFGPLLLKTTPSGQPPTTLPSFHAACRRHACCTHPYCRAASMPEDEDAVPLRPKPGKLGSAGLSTADKQPHRLSPGMICIGRGVRILREGSRAQMQFLLLAQGLGKKHKPCSISVGWHRCGDRARCDDTWQLSANRGVEVVEHAARRGSREAHTRVGGEGQKYLSIS